MMQAGKTRCAGEKQRKGQVRQTSMASIICFVLEQQHCQQYDIYTYDRVNYTK